MAMTTVSMYQQKVSPTEALWMMYQSQSKRVRKAFRTRLLAEEYQSNVNAEMESYARKLSPEVLKSVCMMAAAVRNGKKDVQEAIANNTHVGRRAEEFLAELEQE